MINISDFREKISEASSLRETQKLAFWLLGYVSGIEPPQELGSVRMKNETDNEEDRKCAQDGEPSTNLSIHRTCISPPSGQGRAKQQRRAESGLFAIRR